MIEIETVVILAGLALAGFGYHLAFNAVPRDVWERTNDELDKVIEAFPENQERIIRALADAVLTIISGTIVIEEADEEEQPEE